MTPNRLGAVLTQLVAYRGWRSPEAKDLSYRPDRAPVGGATIRRIMNGERDSDRDELLALDGMLQLPPGTLQCVYDGDTASLEGMEFDGRESLRRFILDAMQPPKRRGRGQRATA